MPVAKVSSKNQIVIPKEAREHLGLKSGDCVIVVPRGNGVYLLKQPKSYRKALRGIASGLYPADYIKQERQNWN